MVLRVAVSPQAFAARAIERQTGRVHEDQREIAEQIAAALEQALLDQVLDAARRQGTGRGGRHLLAEPGHRAVEVVQLQPVDPGDPVVGHPFLAAAVRARHKQPVQHTGKDGALDRKLKTAVLEQLVQHRGNAEPLPDPPEQQRPANARAGDAARLHVGQDDGAIAMPHQRGGQTIQFAARHQHVLAAKRADDPLADATTLALVLDEIEIAMASRCLLADKHRRVVRGFADNIKRNLTTLLKMFHYTIGEIRKFAEPNETNQSVTKPRPSLTVQVGPSRRSDGRTHPARQRDTGSQPPSGHR